MDRRAAAVLALLALTGAVFAGVADHAFVEWDDRVGIVDNPALRATGPLDALERAATSTLLGNWIPLTVLSLQLNHALHGLEPAGYLLGNVLLHAAAAALLFLALWRMTGAPAPSLFVAAVFAVHPLHVESVAWASARKDCLSGLFWMAALLAHARQAERPGRGRAALVLLCVAGALLSKPTAVTLPFALLLLDYWPLRRLFPLRRALVEKLPQLALVAAISAVTFAIQASAGATGFGERLPAGVRLAAGLESYAIYLRQAFWPVGLAYFYPHPATLGDAALRPALLASLLLAGASAAAVALRRERPHLLVGWLWFLGTLVPVIGWVQVGVQAHADRYMYLPLVGLAIALAFEAARRVEGRRTPAALLAAAGALGVLAMAIAARAQVAVWRDSDTLRAHAVAVTEHNFKAHRGIAAKLLREGRLDEAEPHLREAAAADFPLAHEARVDLADLQVRRGRVGEAIALYGEVLRERPDHARAHANLGLALVREGRRAEARTHLERALQLGRPPSVPPERWARIEQALARLRESEGERTRP